MSNNGTGIEEDEGTENKGVEPDRRERRIQQRIKENCTVETKVEDTVDDLWQRMSEAVVEICVKTKEGSSKDKDTWWWDEQVQRALRNKEAAYKALKDEAGDQGNYSSR